MLKTTCCDHMCIVACGAVDSVSVCVHVCVQYENMYKPMQLLSYAEHEAWRVPVDSLVELGMVVYI